MPVASRFFTLATLSVALCARSALAAEPLILSADSFVRHVERFNANDVEDVVNLIPNADAWAWIKRQAPLFECPSGKLEETYYFRWWTYRKHIKETPDGRVLTEFITPVSHAGKHNTVSCALGHHIAEGRWLSNQGLIDEYVRFWFESGEDGGPAPHFHKFSSWVAAALYDRYLVTGDDGFLVDTLDELVDDYRKWEEERQTPEGLFWQHDVKDGMEESISGGRRVKNVRPTINSYMAANARAISRIAAMAGRGELAREFEEKYRTIHGLMIEQLWDEEAGFFKVRLEDGGLSDVREEIGFIPWMFGLADARQGRAWVQLSDPEGFRGPWGITTAERRHPAFRTHGVGTCEWDGAVWPFATSQTLTGLANYLRDDPEWISKREYFDQMVLYAQSHERNGKPYIGEYLDEQTGDWLITGKKALRSRFYNHSTFNDLVISGLVGLVPQEGDTLVVDPLIPEDAWDWFCLDGVPYHGMSVTIVWDRDGRRYGRGAGLIVYADGNEVARSEGLVRTTAVLPEQKGQGDESP